jgi:hypothetical protein
MHELVMSRVRAATRVLSDVGHDLIDGARGRRRRQTKYEIQVVTEWEAFVERQSVGKVTTDDNRLQRRD